MSISYAAACSRASSIGAAALASAACQVLGAERGPAAASGGLRRAQCRAQAFLLFVRQGSLEDARLEALQLRENLIRCRSLDQHEQGRRTLRYGLAEIFD